MEEIKVEKRYSLDTQFPRNTILIAKDIAVARKDNSQVFETVDKGQFLNFFP